MIYHKAESPCGIDKCVCARVDTSYVLAAGLVFDFGVGTAVNALCSTYFHIYPTFSPYKSHQFIETVSIFFIFFFASLFRTWLRIERVLPR